MKPTDRLYLSKQEGQEIYFDICDLPQHQIDGIRFLYRQFKKKNKGVILNDPPGYGEVVQVVLFLGAIHTLLSQSILILCREDKANSWIQDLQTWTSFDDNEILIESFNPNRNKMVICINTMNNIAHFSKRTWSVVIVDDDDNENTKQIFKLMFKTNFKIWITSQDVKENLKTFSQIHKWLIPDYNFVMQDFIPNNKRNVQEVVTKSILLDAFMQDIVIRRNDLPVKDEHTSNTNTLKSKLSRKNKDTTGTKIKWSKKTIDKDISMVNKVDPCDYSVMTPDNDQSMLREIKVSEIAEMDVETFVKQEKLIGLETIEEPQYMNVDKNTKDNETSIVESDTSIDNNVPDIATELGSIENPSVSTKDKDINKSYTNIINIDKNEDKEINSAINFQIDNEFNMNYGDIRENYNVDDVNNLKNHEVTKMKSENNSHKTIDEMIKETEEKTLKKFKGSLLDNIF